MKLLLTLSLLMLLSVKCIASNIEITWASPTTFKDIRPSIENKNTYNKEVMEQIENYFKKLAKKLPEDKFLFVNITDIDLAGAVTFSNSKKIRLISSATPPEIDFSFQLIDSNNKLLVSRSVQLKPKHFKFRDDRLIERPLYHEYDLLKNWFENTFSPIIK